MSVESTLPHGLKTSNLGSAYKVEYDQNLTLLDNDRITVGDVSVRPAFGVARRFWFDPTTKQLSYDDGTQWVEDLTKQSSLIVESLSTLNQDLTTDADVAFNSINAGSMALTGALPVTSGGTGISTNTNVPYGNIGISGSLTKSTVQIIATTNPTKVIDWGGGHTSSGGGPTSVTIDGINGKITLDTPGRYFVSSQILMSGGTNNRTDLYKNGIIHSVGQQVGVGVVGSMATVSDYIVSDGNDFVEVFVTQSSGTDKNISGDAKQNRLMLHWIGF